MKRRWKHSPNLSEIEIFAPDEIARLLSRASLEFKPPAIQKRINNATSRQSNKRKQ